MVRLGMDLGRDGLEHEHDPVASNDGPEVVSFSVAAALITNVKPQLGLVERKRSGQVVDNKKGSDSVQHSETAVSSNIACVYSRTFIAYAGQIVQSAGCPLLTHNFRFTRQDFSASLCVPSRPLWLMVFANKSPSFSDGLKFTLIRGKKFYRPWSPWPLSS